MPAVEVSKACDWRRRFYGTCNDPVDSVGHDVRYSLCHAVSGLADGDGRQLRDIAELVKVLADVKLFTAISEVSRKRLGNAAFCQRVFEYFERPPAHFRK